MTKRLGVAEAPVPRLHRSSQSDVRGVGGTETRSLLLLWDASDRDEEGHRVKWKVDSNHLRHAREQRESSRSEATRYGRDDAWYC